MLVHGLLPHYLIILAPAPGGGVGGGMEVTI